MANSLNLRPEINPSIDFLFNTFQQLIRNVLNSSRMNCENVCQIQVQFLINFM